MIKISQNLFFCSLVICFFLSFFRSEIPWSIDKRICGFLSAQVAVWHFGAIHIDRLKHNHLPFLGDGEGVGGTVRPWISLKSRYMKKAKISLKFYFVKEWAQRINIDWLEENTKKNSFELEKIKCDFQNIVFWPLHFYVWFDATYLKWVINEAAFNEKTFNTKTIKLSFELLSAVIIGLTIAVFEENYQAKMVLR